MLDQRLSVIAVFDDGTAHALWVARAAQCAPVPYEINVEGIEFSFRHDSVHDLMRAPVRALLRDEADAAQYSEDMRVQRKYFFATSEQKSAGDGLRADAAKLPEIIDGRILV